MTERAFLKECAPKIAEIACECQMMTEKEYADIKQDIMASVPEQAKAFMSKVFMIVEQCLAEK